MPFEPEITIKPTATKPASRPNTRATLRDLTSSHELRIFRRASLFRRLLNVFVAARRNREL